MERHIVIDARQYSTSSGRYVRELISHLEQIDPVNRYTILLQPGDMDSCSLSNKKFSKQAAPFAQFSFAEQIQLLSLLKKLKPDLVHFAFVQQPLLYFGKQITTVHDLTTLRYKSNTTNSINYHALRSLYSLMVRVAIAKSKTVITPTEYVKTELVKINRKIETKGVVTYEAATESDDATTPYNEMTSKKYIMYTGRSAPHKNLKKLVDAFKILKDHNPDLHLVFVGGDKNYKLIERYSQKQKIEDVHFAGFVPDPELNWLYANTLAYVFPSLSEGFGLPGLEAMAQGAPVVSSNATCLPEVYGDAALYFNPDNPEDMALKIERVLSDKTFRKQLISKGYKQVKKYSWTRMAEQTLEFYQSLLNK